MKSKLHRSDGQQLQPLGFDPSSDLSILNKSMKTRITAPAAFALLLLTWIGALVGTIEAAQLSGSVIGTPGSWQNSGNGVANVFDGDINTFFDAPDPGTGDWAGLDFGPGATDVITSIVFAPRAGFSGRMVGGKVQAANLADFSDAVTLYTIASAPNEGVYTTLTVTPAVTTPFRYARYLAPDPSWGNISELQFWGYGPGVNLAYRQPVVASTSSTAGNAPANAVDGSTNSAWISASGSSQWIYVDLGASLPVASARITWGAGYAKAFQIQSSNDATNWTSIYATSGATGGVFNASFSPTTTRYVRLNCTQSSGAAGYGVQEFAVFGTITAPTVTALPATAVTSTTALLNWQITSTGGQVPTVSFYYGLIDGGTSATNWTGAAQLGQQSGAFSYPVSGLVPNTTYYYTAYASNSVGASWAVPSGSFTTPAPASLSVVTNHPATDVQALIATVSGQVTSTGGGGETPAVTIYYGPADGGSSAAGWTYSLYLGAQSGNFSTTLSGLVPLTKYFFTASVSNSAGIVWAGPSLDFTTIAAPPAIPVLTYHYDNTRQGANLAETVLTPANVSGGTFGRLFTYPVDGHVYAQPLIMTNVSIPGKGIHNVVYVATQHDSLYAFDADSYGDALWHVNFGVSAVTPNNDWGNRYGPYHDINPEVGITGTPVIDPSTGTIYLDVFSHEGTVYLHRIHALDIATGTERAFSPVPVTATVSGKGVGSSGGVLNFDSRRSLNRAAFTLAGGVLFATYTGYADTDPYHGWIIGYDVATLTPLTNYVFNTSPNSTIATWGANAGECGIWMAGHGLCVDANTNIFFEVGNGPFNANVTSGSEYGDSFVKLSGAAGLHPVDYFTPYNQASLSASDSDLGSGGPIILPDSVGSAAHPHLLVGCGKEGKIYLLDRDNLGHYNTANDNAAVQTLPGAVGGTWSSPAYFNNRIYYLGSGDVLKAFAITNGVITPTPVSRGSAGVGYPGSTPVVSANGNQNGIVWTIQSDAYSSGGAAILRANNATNVAIELYNSSQNLGRDNPGGAVKYTVPVVANGKVYVPAQFGVAVYGLGTFLATPTISPNGGIFTNSVLVSIADVTPGATIYYTIDGTTPTASSILYNGPFALTNSVSVQAVATKAGSVNSGIAKASFLNISQVGNGNGLLGQYWSSHTPDDPFSGIPTLTRLDPTVDFEWGNGSPDATISSDHFTARWTGSIQPQFNEIYTLYTTTDDGVRVFINGQPVIDQWVDQAPTEARGTVNLKAQQRYSIEMDYYENGGGAVAHLSWSSPSTTKTIIPATQLYPVVNPPPGVVLNGPTNGAFYTAPASVSLDATAAAQFNKIDHVSFYIGSSLLGTLTSSPYVFTATDLGVGNYTLTAVATDLTGLSATSAPVAIKITAGSGQPYGVAVRPVVPAYYNMPQAFNGSIPPLLSQTGVLRDAAKRTTAEGLIPYEPISQLWSDGAVKSRFMAIPYTGGLNTPGQQVTFATTGEWAFPSGTVFVKNFDMVTDETNTNAPLRRLETRLLVRNPSGSVYGVTYKWRPDNSDADLLTTSLHEDILITNSFGVRTQNWYYPSPADCLTCHTPAANYVLGVKTRQLNSLLTYASSGKTDNQLRTLNHLGVFNPAIDESTIPSLAHLVSITDTNATLENRVRSYLDANCANCHRPNGVRANFDARYDTALADQNIVNGIVLGSLGVDNAHVVTPDDIWRSVLYQRANSLDALIKMPPLARNTIDTNAIGIIGQWINSLPGTPTLPPPIIAPAGGQFDSPVSVTVQYLDTNAIVRYTLDNSLPTTNSTRYSGPFLLTSNAIVQVKSFEAGFNDSIAATALFTVGTPVHFTARPTLVSGSFHLPFAGVGGRSYILEASSDFHLWIPLSTNGAVSGQFEWIDPALTNVSYRFYRAREAQ